MFDEKLTNYLRYELPLEQLLLLSESNRKMTMELLA